jgi:hypothetical protein
MDESSPIAPRRHLLAATLYCLAATVLFFRGPLLMGRYYHIPYDLADFHYPLLALIASSLKEFGCLPWWNPYSYMGEPFFSNVQAAIFYPPTLVTAVAGNALSGRVTVWWMGLLLAAHVALAGVGAYRLLRAVGVGFRAALAGTTVYHLGAFFAAQTQHLGAICVAAWLPWTLCALRRLEQKRDWPSVALAALAIGLMILTGFPPAWLPALFLLPLFYVWWMWQRHPRLAWKPQARPAALLAVAAAMGLLISAVSWLPASQLAERSVAQWRFPAQAVEGVPLEALTSLFWPNLFNQLRGEFWHSAHPAMVYLYQGIPALLLVLAGFTWLLRSSAARPFLAGAAVSGMWMFGASFPVSALLYLLYPNVVRRGIYPSMLLAYFSLFFAVLAAMALDGWERGERSRLFPARICARAAIVALAGGLVTCAAGNYVAGMPPAAVRASNAGGSLLLAAAVLGLCGLIARQATAGRMPRVRVSALLCALILFDLLAVGSHSMFNAGSGDGDPPHPAVAWLKARLGPQPVYRIDTWDVGYAWQTKLPRWQLPSANGMNPLLLKDVVMYRKFFSRVDDRQFILEWPQSPLLDLAGIRYVVTSRASLPGMERVHAGDANIFENRRAFPRYFLVGGVTGARDIEEAAAKIHYGAVDPSRTVVVPDSDVFRFGALSQPATSAELGTVELLSWSPNEVRVRTIASRPAALVITETYWPDWKAGVDGKAQPLVRADGLFRAVPVPAGSHEIQMKIVPSLLYLGGALSLGGLLLAVGCLLGAARQAAAKRGES